MSEQALILAGGLGTRLGKLTKVKPKPMMEIDGKPFLEHLIDFLKRFGIKDIVVTSGYLGEIIEDYFGNGEKLGVKISYIQEKELLGTGGAIKNARELLQNQFYVLNGDAFCNVDLNKLKQFHINSISLFTMALTLAEDEDNEAVVTDEESKILKVLQRHTPEAVEHRKNNTAYINGGVYYVNKEVLDLIPEGKVSLENEMFPLFIEKVPFYAIKFNTKVHDIGTPERLEHVKKKLELK